MLVVVAAAAAITLVGADLVFDAAIAIVPTNPRIHFLHMRLLDGVHRPFFAHALAVDMDAEIPMNPIR